MAIPLIPIAIGVWIAGGFAKDVAKFMREGKTQEAILAQAKKDKSTTAAAESKLVKFLMAERNKDRKYQQETLPQRERENMMLGAALDKWAQPSQVPGMIAGAVNQFAGNSQQQTMLPPAPPRMSIANLMSF
jgi:hypothetical protein